MKKSKVAIYCRVDSGGNPQIRREALELQKRKLELYAQEKGISISGYYEDDGACGHDLQRPGLARLIKDCKMGIFEQVLVVNRSRIYRGTRWSEPSWLFQICTTNPLEHSLL